MKKKLKKIIPAAVTVCVICWLLNPFAFKIPKYKIPDDHIKISTAYNGDVLIILCNKCFHIYGTHGQTTVDLPKNFSYKDFCAANNNDIMFLDSNGNAVHYINGRFNETVYHNIKSICYIVGAYLFLDDSGNVYRDDKLLCTLENAEKLIGSAEAEFALENIMYSDGSDMYNYNMRSDVTECLKNCTSAEINLCGALMISDGKLIGFSAPDYKFNEIKNDKSADITHITSRLRNSGYLILYKNGKIEAFQPDSGSLTKIRKISGTASSLSYYNPLRNDLAYCQGYVRIVNGISSVDNIYSSASGGMSVNQQCIFIQSGDYIFLYY